MVTFREPLRDRLGDVCLGIWNSAGRDWFGSNEDGFVSFVGTTLRERLAELQRQGRDAGGQK